MGGCMHVDRPTRNIPIQKGTPFLPVSGWFRGIPILGHLHMWTDPRMALETEIILDLQECNSKIRFLVEYSWMNHLELHWWYLWNRPTNW